MAKFTSYECDGKNEHGEACEAYAECEPGEFPAGWLTLTVEARIHSGHRAPGGRGRDRKHEEKPHAADWLHLCPHCVATREAEGRLMAVVGRARTKRMSTHTEESHVG